MDWYSYAFTVKNSVVCRCEFHFTFRELHNVLSMFGKVVEIPNQKLPNCLFFSFGKYCICLIKSFKEPSSRFNVIVWVQLIFFWTSVALLGLVSVFGFDLQFCFNTFSRCRKLNFAARLFWFYLFKVVPSKTLSDPDHPLEFLEDCRVYWFEEFGILQNHFEYLGYLCVFLDHNGLSSVI